MSGGEVLLRLTKAEADALQRRELVLVVTPGERYGGRRVDVYRAVPSAAGEAALDAAAAADRGEE